MYEVFFDALIDTAKMIPFLLLIYIGIEFVEYKFGHLLKEKVKYAGKMGPALGAMFGSVPQCGFSVITTALYTKRLITLGTLLAVYLSTSDEAVPVILSQPDKIRIIMPLLLTKIVIALAAGYIIDFISNRLKNRKTVVNKTNVSSNNGEKVNECRPVPEEDLHLEGQACCGHSCITEKPNYKELILHPIIHTGRVIAFIFVVSLLINLVIYRIGESNLHSVLLSNSIFQPMLAGLVGLIPNCAASVAITQVFLKGGISYGSAIAGLSSSAGLGIIVLFKENESKAETFKIIGLLYGISVIAGIAIQYIYG